MIANQDHYLAHVDEIEPAPVRRDEGWRNMDIRFIVTRDLAGSHLLCVFRTVFTVDAAHERHRHPNAAEFLYVIRGRAAVGAGDQEHVAEPGTVQFIPAGRVHWLRNLDPNEPVEIVGGYVGAASLDEAGYEYVGAITSEFQKAGS